MPESQVQSKPVVLLADDDPKQNLSKDAWRAWEEPPVKVTVSWFSGRVSPDGGSVVSGAILESGAPQYIDSAAGAVTPTGTTSRPAHKFPTHVTLKERLEKNEVDEMLDDPDEWELVVPNGSGQDLLTKDMLRKACQTQTTGTVTMPLTQLGPGDKATYDNALETLTPKAGAARVATAMGAPVTNIALVALAAGAFVGWKPDLDVSRSGLLVVAAICAVLSVIGSLAGTLALRGTTIRLARLDLLRRESGPPNWLPMLWCALFILAIGFAFFSVVPPSHSKSPTPSFSAAKTNQLGQRSQVSFTVSWSGLSTDAAAVRTSARVSEGQAAAERIVTTPKASEGTVTQPISLTVQAPVTITVTTQAVDAGKPPSPVGDEVKHTYKIP